MPSLPEMFVKFIIAHTFLVISALSTTHSKSDGSRACSPSVLPSAAGF
ncbi:hypothetical protein KWL66_005720 [Clostridioides difficile]|nr:hypothetical protein [Clostridioides difficile]MBZ0665546.1 hypothetical protein [Clostridioides difficile]MBZ0956303.1 hypothetical protein [Clostridioides difficile]MCI4311708.1 hypothetical protein [Clostridioides difficile]HBF2930091.1 hypothetical protein [Clostridioides difficile]